MGNKLSSTTNKNGKRARGKPSGSSLFSQQQEGLGIDAGTLEAELKAAQETALKLSAGVDLLADEIRLEQQLAALDDEVLDDDDVGKLQAEGGLDDDVDIDPDELAELEGELQELEREVLGAADEDEDGDAALQGEHEEEGRDVFPGMEDEGVGEEVAAEAEPKGLAADATALHAPPSAGEPSTGTSAAVTTTVTTAALATALPSSGPAAASASSAGPESVAGSSPPPRPMGRDMEAAGQGAAVEPSGVKGPGCKQQPAQAEAPPPAPVARGYEDDYVGDDEPLAVAQWG